MIGNPNNSRRLETAEMQRQAAKRDREIEKTINDRIFRRGAFEALITSMRKRDKVS